MGFFSYLIAHKSQTLYFYTIRTVFSDSPGGIECIIIGPALCMQPCADRLAQIRTPFWGLRKMPQNEGLFHLRIAHIALSLYFLHNKECFFG